VTLPRPLPNPIALLENDPKKPNTKNKKTKKNKKKGLNKKKKIQEIEKK